MEGDMEKTEIEFDCLDAHWAVEQLGKIFYDHDDLLHTYAALGVQIHIDFFGRAGGNPCVTISELAEPVAERVRAFLAEAGLGWSERGEIFDYTMDRSGAPAKCPKCWQPAEYCEVHRS